MLWFIPLDSGRFENVCVRAVRVDGMAKTGFTLQIFSNRLLSLDKNTHCELDVWALGIGLHADV